MHFFNVTLCTGVSFVSTTSVHCIDHFVVDGKLNAAHALRNQLNRSSPQFVSPTFLDALHAKYGDTYENFIHEQMYHGVLLAAVTEFERWRDVNQKRLNQL